MNNRAEPCFFPFADLTQAYFAKTFHSPRRGIPFQRNAIKILFSGGLFSRRECSARSSHNNIFHIDNNMNRYKVLYIPRASSLQSSPVLSNSRRQQWRQDGIPFIMKTGCGIPPPGASENVWVGNCIEFYMFKWKYFHNGATIPFASIPSRWCW